MTAPMEMLRRRVGGREVWVRSGVEVGVDIVGGFAELEI